jgi:hypothetical protein
MDETPNLHRTQGQDSRIHPKMTAGNTKQSVLIQLNVPLFLFTSTSLCVGTRAAISEVNSDLTMSSASTLASASVIDSAESEGFFSLSEPHQNVSSASQFDRHLLPRK